MRTAPLPLPPALDLAALRRGHPDAIAAAYRQHAGRLLRLATGLLGDRAAGEDLVHDLFVGLPETLGQYREQGSFGPWLSRMTARMALMRMRAARRRPDVPLDVADELSGPADAEQLATRLLVDGALARLPADARALIVLRDLEGWSYPDIAELVGVSEGTLMTRHSRAMQRLRHLLKGER